MNRKSLMNAIQIAIRAWLFCSIMLKLSRNSLTDNKFINMIKLNSENYCTFVAIKRTIMAKIGYVWLAPQFDTLNEDKKWMTDYG